MSRLFRRRPLAGLAALAGLGLLAAGCSGGGGSAAPGGLEETTINVAAAPALDSAGLYIAQTRGLFAAEGLRVNISPAISGQTTIAQQLKGQFAVTVGNYVSYIRSNAIPNPKQRGDFRVLAAASIMQASNQMIVVPKSSTISTVSGLANKKIGVNVTDNLGTLLVSSVLSDNAVDPNSVTFVPIQFSDMANALARGQVQAAWVPEPFATQDEEQIGAVPLADANQGSTQNLPISGYMVTASWLKKNPNTAAAFRTAILKAQAIAAVNPSAVEQGMEKYASVTQEVASIASEPEYPTQQNPDLLNRLAGLMLTFGMLPQSYNVKQMIVKP